MNIWAADKSLEYADLFSGVISSIIDICSKRNILKPFSENEKQALKTPHFGAVQSAKYKKVTELDLTTTGALPVISGEGFQHK